MREKNVRVYFSKEAHGHVMKKKPRGSSRKSNWGITRNARESWEEKKTSSQTGTDHWLISSIWWLVVDMSWAPTGGELIISQIFTLNRDESAMWLSQQPDFKKEPFLLSYAGGFESSSHWAFLQRRWCFCFVFYWRAWWFFCCVQGKHFVVT